VGAYPLSHGYRLPLTRTLEKFQTPARRSWRSSFILAFPQDESPPILGCPFFQARARIWSSERSAGKGAPSSVGFRLKKEISSPAPPRMIETIFEQTFFGFPVSNSLFCKKITPQWAVRGDSIPRAFWKFGHPTHNSRFWPHSKRFFRGPPFSFNLRCP